MTSPAGTGLGVTVLSCCLEVTASFLVAAYWPVGPWPRPPALPSRKTALKVDSPGDYPL